MQSFDKEFINIGYLDTLSYKQTLVHRLHPCTKLIVTFAFIVTVVSFPKYEIQGIMPFFLFPVFIISAGDIPVALILKKLLVVSPFVLFVGIFNPVLDTRIMYYVYGLEITGGWISFASITVKFILTVSSALLLVAVTSFPGICYALQRLGVPKIFIVQLLFLYRYIFVLAEETMRIVRARNMRSFGKRGKGIKSFTSLLGVLLVRSMERAESIYQAMCSRAFDGSIRLVNAFSLTLTDMIFAAITITAFIIFRRYDVAEMLGELLLT